MGYESPFTATKINSIPEELTTGAGGMTIPLHMQRGGPMSAMLHHHHQPRSKFMITDILGGAGGKLLQSSENEDDDRTPSPQPRDLSASSLRHDDSDEDQSDSSMLDDHSVCSGNYQFSSANYFHVCNITSHFFAQIDFVVQYLIPFDFHFQHIF